MVHFENHFGGGALCERRPNECLVTLVPAYVTCARCLELLTVRQPPLVLHPGAAANESDEGGGSAD